METMKPIYFITGNEGKFREARGIMSAIQQIKLELPEEQSLDPHFVISKKLEFAGTKRAERPLIVEDTSLYIDGLNGFPGPLIRWMELAVGNDGIYDLCAKIGNNRATAKTVVGYLDENSKTEFFEGEISGQIVKPNGNEGFGWDSIFQPDGISETFAEMGDEFKTEFSMRTIAFSKLMESLDKMHTAS